MRKIHEYQVIRYFPNELSDEFINVGVMLKGTVKKEHIISKLEATYLYSSVLIGDDKKFYAMIDYLHSDTPTIQSPLFLFTTPQSNYSSTKDLE